MTLTMAMTALLFAIVPAVLGSLSIIPSQQFLILLLRAIVYSFLICQPIQ